MKYKGYTILATTSFVDLDVDEDGDIDTLDSVEPDTTFHVYDGTGFNIEDFFSFDEAKAFIDERMQEAA